MYNLCTQVSFKMFNEIGRLVIILIFQNPLNLLLNLVQRPQRDSDPQPQGRRTPLNNTKCRWATSPLANGYSKKQFFKTQLCVNLAFSDSPREYTHIYILWVSQCLGVNESVCGCAYPTFSDFVACCSTLYHYFIIFSKHENREM